MSAVSSTGQRGITFKKVIIQLLRQLDC